MYSDIRKLCVKKKLKKKDILLGYIAIENTRIYIKSDKVI